MHIVRLTETPSLANECALVLTAAGIPNAVAPNDDGWAVVVAPDDITRAESVLAAWDDERRTERAAHAEPEAPYPWMSGVALGLVLLWLYSVTGVPSPGSRWFEHGAAVAGRITGGEPWRAVTALTLHADIVHVVGNACALAVLLPPLAQRFGVGAGLLLLLLAGAAGNVLAAFVHDPRHSGVGASTAGFGAVGILVAVRLMAREASYGRKRWTVPVAGLVLVAFLSAAPRVDIAAHTFGFLAGLAVGVAAALALRVPPGLLVQWIAGSVSAAIVALCWRAALPRS
jgi:membrane associated rhomboid family serine protease